MPRDIDSLCISLTLVKQSDMNLTACLKLLTNYFIFLFAVADVLSWNFPRFVVYFVQSLSRYQLSWSAKMFSEAFSMFVENNFSNILAV